MADIKSSIREVRDQFFLDRAVSKYLSNVTSNLSFERPVLWFSDDSLWRAVIRRISLDYRQIANLFYDLLTEIFGPQKTVATVLISDAVILDEVVSIAPYQQQHRHAIPVTFKTLPQRGILIIDEGLATEETVQYSFRDPRTGVINLLAELTQAHTAVGTNASGYVLSDVPSALGTTTIPLTHTNDFPTSGFPYPILIAPGTSQEEVTLLTGNDPVTSVLTVASLANDQYGMRETPTTSKLVSITGSDAHVIKIQDSNQFPEEGWIKVQQDVTGGLPSEVVEVIDNDVATGTLTLRTKLVGSYTLGSVTVSVLEPRTSVQLAQVQVKGIGWDVFQTEQNVLKLYIPLNLSRNRLQDVSFLHDLALLPPPTTTLASSVSIGDVTLEAAVGSTERFPKSGIMIINSGGGSEEKVSYTRVDAQSSTKLYATDIGGTIPVGTTELFVEDITPIEAFDKINKDKKLVLSRDQGSPNEEVVYYESLDGENNKITLTIATLQTHLPGSLVTPISGDIFYLTTPAVNAHSIGESLSLQQMIYAGTGTQATGKITVPAGVDMSDGDFFTLPNGINKPFTFEFDNDATLGYVGRIPVTFVGTETANQIRDLIIAAVNGTLIDITASIGGPAWVALTHDYKGKIGNRPIKWSVNSPNFTVLGMSDGTDPLWDGKIFTPVDHLFQGHFLYSPGSQAPNTVRTTLESNVAGPQLLEVTQHVTRTTLEVATANFFDATGEFSVTVRGGGNSETLDVQGITLRGAGPVTVTSNTPSGSYVIPLTGAGLLPAPPAGAPYGYRIIIHRNGVRQEVVVVVSIAGGSCTLESPTTVNHLTGDSVELMADVIKLSQPLTYDHDGRIPWSSRLNVTPGPLTSVKRVSLVYEERKWIEVASLTGFPPLGSKIILNFGNDKLPIESGFQTDLSAGSGILILDDTSKFPTSGYPYLVEIDSDAGSIASFWKKRNVRETIDVTLNDPLTNTMTLATPLKESHLTGSLVRYKPGPMVVFPYNSTLTGPARLVFQTSLKFERSHVKGESVMLSEVTSIPTARGTDYAFYLPSTWADRLKYLFDRGRAAGVQVVVINEK